MAQESTNIDRSRSDAREAERYREAAEAALDQLDWCIAYLHRIRKSPIATVIERNKSGIRERLR